jgi:two-component system copper resistance phosphate regulon response regulator CusR
MIPAHALHMRILLVEDDTAAAAVLAKGLREHSFAVDIAADGRDALEHIHANTYDLVLLDILLPYLNGLEVCEAIRKLNLTCPVLMLTALDGIANRIEGLDRGADDYLCKPFDFGELLARIRALSRRRPEFQNPVLQIDDLQINTASHKVSRGGKEIELTAREYALLEYLALHQGKVVGRAEISEHVWDERYDPFSNLIEVYVQKLRRKIDHDPGTRLIHTRRGEGYILSAA